MSERKEMEMNERERWNNVVNEGGDGFNPYDAALEAEVAALEAAAVAEFAAGWTLEVTTARRAQYNAWATSHRSASTVDADRYARSLGFTVSALLRAIRVNRL